MAAKAKQWGAIIVMIALFAMIAFVTNLCSPMAVIVKNQYGASNFLSQIGNYGNFIAYLVMGIPSGMLIKRYGYKKTSLIALAVGIIGILVQWASGWAGFGVYLIGAFIAGFCMCMLNTVVNPMLNLLGGGGNKGNQLIQIGGVFNSAAAVAVYIIMGALIGEATKAKISDATPALMIALAIFVIGFIVILFTKIEEPAQPVEVKSEVKDKYSAFSFRHFKLGILAIFLYGGIEVGTPTYIMQYLTAQPDAATPGFGMNGTIVGLIVAVYWLMMLVGRFCSTLISGKVSPRTQLAVVSSVAIVLVLAAIFTPKSVAVSMPGYSAGEGFTMFQVPLSCLFLVLCGLCTSVMWGVIFALAVEGLGKYTEAASGIFMMLVVGGGIMPLIQEFLAKGIGYMPSYWLVVAMLAYLLYYALAGSKNVNKDIPVE